MKNEDQDIRNFEEKFGKDGKQPFSVPEGYFEKLPGRITESISQRSKPKETKIFMLRPAVVSALAAAAIILIVIGLNFNSFMNYFDGDTIVENPVNFQTVSDEEIVEFLASEELSEDMIMEIASSGTPYISPMNASEQEMEEYLNEQNESDLLMEDL